MVEHKAVTTDPETGQPSMTSIGSVEAPIFKGQLLRVLCVDESGYTTVQVVWAPEEAVAAGVKIGAKYIINRSKIQVFPVSKALAASLMTPQPGGLDVQA